MQISIEFDAVFRYALVVTATDQAEPPSSRLTSTATVLILVEDETDVDVYERTTPKNVPKRSTPKSADAPLSFPPGAQVFAVAENARRGRVIGQIRVENPGGSDLAWSMRHRYRHGGIVFREITD